MNARETRQYEMAIRVRDVCTTYPQVFAGPGAAGNVVTDLTGAIDDLAATNVATRTASVAARIERKAAARVALNGLLVKASQTAKVLDPEGTTRGTFALPSDRSDQVLLTLGRQFARDTSAREGEFAANGMPSKLIADTTDAFEAAMRDRGMSRSDLTASRTRARKLLARALAAVRRLDVIVNNQVAGDDVFQAVWKQARRVDDPYRTRSTNDPPSPAAAAGENPLPTASGM